MTTAVVTEAHSLNYDYTRIPEQDRENVRTAAVEIKSQLRTTVDTMIAVGQSLLTIRDSVPHGQWQDWLQDEFALGERTAQEFMNVARRFGGDVGSIAQLPGSALRLLAAPSTPDEAIQEVERRIETGSIPTVAEVRSVVQEHKPARRTLNQIETEAVIARYLERHYATASDSRKLEILLGMNVMRLQTVVQEGRHIDPDTFADAQMLIAGQIKKRIDDRAPGKTIPITSHAEWSFEKSNGKWRAVNRTTRQATAFYDTINDADAEALSLTRPEERKAAPAPVIRGIRNPHVPLRDDQIRNVVQSIGDSLDILRSARDDAAALNLYNYQLPIDILIDIKNKLETE